METRSMHDSSGWAMEFISNFMGAIFFFSMIFQGVSGTENSWESNFQYFQSSDQKTGALVTPIYGTALGVCPVRQTLQDGSSVDWRRRFSSLKVLALIPTLLL